jgi:hypothetical protein
MLEGDEAYHWVLSFFPQPARARLNATLLRADVRMGKWLLGQGGLMLILGLCSLIVLSAQGPLRVRAGSADGRAEYHSHRWRHGLDGPGVAGGGHRLLGKSGRGNDFLCIYAQVETSLPDAAHHEEQRGLSALGVLVALLMGSKLAGVIGAMIAVPTAVLVSVLIQEYLMQPDAKENGILPVANVAP